MNTNIAKSCMKILNKPMIEYLIDTISNINNIDNNYVILGYKSDDIINILNDKVKYVYQDKILGTGYSLMCMYDYIDDQGYSLILPSDTPLLDINTLNDLINSHLINKNDLTIITTIKDNPFSYGRIIKSFKKIKEIKEEKTLNNKEKKIKEVNTGIYCINNKVLKDNIFKIKLNSISKEYYFTDIVKILSKKYKIGRLNIKDSFKTIGINDLNTLLIVEEEYKKHIIKKHINNGVIIKDISNTYIEKNVIINKGTIIESGSILKGRTIINSNCIIGPNTYLDNVLCKENTSIIYSYITDSIIESNCKIGPYTHIRQNSKIGSYSKIGNFTEIKESSLGLSNKASHLTYIGNTITEYNINFGCGVITANYDGINKYNTYIGNNTFIGSNSILIAPITIGNNCFIAGSSVVNKSILDNMFVISRPDLIIKENKK